MTLLGGAATSSALRLRPAHAQPAKVRRLGVLSQGSARAHPVFQAFQQGLRELGWLEGQNLAIEWRFSEGSAEPLARLAAELVRLPVDVIVARSTPPALAAKEATSTIPVVFIQVADPVESGIVASLSRPGANVTGLSVMATDLSGKRLELLKEVLPGAARVAVLWNRPSRGAALVLRELELAGRQLGLELKDIGVSDPGELKGAVESAARAHVAAVMVIDDPVIASYQPQIVPLAAAAALPIFSWYSEYLDGGGLMAYGPSLPEIYRRGAVYVDRILRGARPSELPVEQPAIFELAINLRTAKALGLDLAPTLVARANRVVE
jgi:putative tryptophan/tyrosine transport system substrate-binding protein